MAGSGSNSASVSASTMCSRINTRTRPCSGTRCVSTMSQMRGCTQRRLHSVPYRWVRFPVETEDSPEQETLYLEGTTAAGQPEGKRFPTASGKLEFWTESLEAKFNALGLSVIPEFYSEREQLIDLPYVRLTIDDAADGALSPFGKVPTSRPRVRSYSRGMTRRAWRCGNEASIPNSLLAVRPPRISIAGRIISGRRRRCGQTSTSRSTPTGRRSGALRTARAVRVETAHGEIEAVPGFTRGSARLPCSSLSAGASSSPSIPGARSISLPTRRSVTRSPTRQT